MGYILAEIYSRGLNLELLIDLSVISEAKDKIVFWNVDLLGFSLHFLLFLPATRHNGG